MSEPKSILFFISDLIGGGAQRVLVNLTNALVSDGYDVAIATNTAVKPSYSFHPKIKILNFREGCDNAGLMTKFPPYRKIRALANIRKISRTTNPDIIVTFIRSMSLEVLLATLCLRIPVICSEHTTVRRNGALNLPFKARLLYKTAAAVTVLTRSDYRFLKSLVKNLVYMPNPSDPKESDSRKEERRKVVLAAGRIKDWKVKGFDNLLKSWGVICNDFPDWSLEIAGAGVKEDIKTLQEIAIDSKCKNVKFLGFRSDINDLMSSSAVFCLSSRFEGLPMVLIEAMNAGCCCVAFDCLTGPSEVIEDEKSGLLADNQNVSDLAEKLRLVMSNEQLREHYSLNAPKSVVKYRSERILNRWKILFDKIVDG